MYVTENSYQVFLPAVGEHEPFLFAIYKLIICKFVENVAYVTLTSCDTSHRCLQSMVMTRSNI